MDVHISLTELFSHPTISLLSTFFAGKADIDHSPVIKLCHCEGGKNIFLFHPVGGSVFCYSDLANLLSHEYSVFAVEAAGFSLERTALNTELYRVEDLAEYYRSEEHTSELQSRDSTSHAVFCLKKKKKLHSPSTIAYAVYSLKTNK